MTITVDMKERKTTPGTKLFEEIGEAGHEDEMLLRTQYVTKRALRMLDPTGGGRLPTKIRVTVEALEF